MVPPTEPIALSVDAVAPKLCKPTVVTEPSLMLMVVLSLYQLVKVELSVHVVDAPELGRVLKFSLAVGDNAVKLICADKKVHKKKDSKNVKILFIFLFEVKLSNILHITTYTFVNNL